VGASLFQRSRNSLTLPVPLGKIQLLSSESGIDASCQEGAKVEGFPLQPVRSPDPDFLFGGGPG
jgi:hypothetical protein